MFCDIAGTHNTMISVAGGILGGINFWGAHKGAGTYPVSDDTERGADIRFTRVDRMELAANAEATIAAASGQVTITEWDETVLVGSFRFRTVSMLDLSGASHTNLVGGSFRAKWQDGC